MFKIGEFSKLTQVSVRMLRYYDENGLLKPAEIDRFTGYRSYSVDQIPTLRRIIFLRDSGFQVAEIAAALKQWDDGTMTEELKKKQEEVRAIARAEEQRAARIGAAIEDLKNQQIDLHCNIVLKSIPAYPALTLREIIPDYYAEGSLWMKLGEQVERENIRLPQNTMNFAIYHDTDFKESDVDVEVCTVLPEPALYRNSGLYRETGEVKTMACFLVYGSFRNIGPGFVSFAQWLTEHEQYTMRGQNRQIVHRGPWNEEDPDKYLTEIQIPVEITA
jgi:DNA-binding transcriptional MerR regulator